VTPARAHHLAGRQLRLQQALLRLRHQLARAPAAGSAAQWERWLARRGELLSEIARHDAPGLAQETADFLRCGAPDPLGGWVARLHARTGEMLREIAAGEARTEKLMVLEVLGLSRRLLAARGASSAQQGYRLSSWPRHRLDRRG